MKVTTFYSYKGGLGRSLLVAECARLLAGKGASVVVIDLDLEAPGLPYKLGFDDRSHLGDGVVGLLRRFQAGQAPPDSLRDWVRPVSGRGQLHLLPAGQATVAPYWRDLAAIEWDPLFRGPQPQGVRFFAWLREAIERDLDPAHVLVDARTGITAMGGAAVTLLADQVVALVGTSRESQYGTREVLRAITVAPRLADNEPVRLGVVLARLPSDLAVEEVQSVRSTVRELLQEEAAPLRATVSMDLPMVVRSERALERDERALLGAESLQVVGDYRRVADWVGGMGVPVELSAGWYDPSQGTGTLRAHVELLRGLSQSNRRLLPDLASDLNSLSIRLSQEGRDQEALQVADEAVALCRRLAQSQFEVFGPYLAGTLDTLGNRFDQVGRLEDALRCSEEAVLIHRRLGALLPGAHDRDMAGVLHNQSLKLTGLRRYQEALIPALEALEIRRRLAGSETKDALLDLAGSLDHLGTLLGEMGRREDALRLAHEAVAVYRRLSNLDGREYGTGLAGALSNLGNRLSEAGDEEQALRVSRESVDLYRRLVQVRRAEFLPELAGALSNLGVMLAGIGQHEESLEATSEAARLLNEVGERSPWLRDRDMPTILGNLGLRLGSLGRHGEALEQLRKAEALYRSHVDLYGIAFQPGLARTLSNLGGALRELGRADEAAAAVDEAVQIARQLAQSNAGAFEPELAKYLANRAAICLERGLVTEAAADGEESVHLYARLVEQRPSAFRSESSRAIEIYRTCCATLGRSPNEALLARIDGASAVDRPNPNQAGGTL